ncbi:DNA methylase [Bacteroides faecis]|uniref:DNA methylase n=1 Tax=Bacteroides thetaiotaomicron TaxID=818 RepID=A0A415LSX7_BACT4|nr:DNA methylase [Bacteroides faecis]MBK1751021.1 DNA methylase [Escherichia coli]MCM0271409.1 DNA methylase [Bacteroides fragilis]RHL52008.1 DNA methylase [Bacteroides thetaiotaomicron]MCM1736499.1 DNA methylase [Bacteroides faecis]MCM1771930.1 DNA methylase [Bacteroides faecis]
MKSELAALDRKIQLELEPPTPEVAEKENDGQEVKPDAEGVRNVAPQHTEDVPQIRSRVNERSPSGNFIADHIIIGRPGFNVRDECKPKGIKM